MPGSMTWVQFDRVAEELGWDLDRQIDVLEGFFEDYGVGGRVEDFLRGRGLSPGIRFHRQALRDALLACVDAVGAHGALSHVLQRALNAAAQQAAQARAAEAAREAAAAKRDEAPRRTRRLLGWIRRRGQTAVS